VGRGALRVPFVAKSDKIRRSSGESELADKRFDPLPATKGWKNGQFKENVKRLCSSCLLISSF
jgi:hypothetical protein